ncbi:MAG: Ig-like domain-containing protein [Paludibacteraceae bacterium]|nr:Ig-like domain-containing protein [Paludibacteraceae bacterium]
MSCLLATILFVLLLPHGTLAAVGDVAGNYYSTDIVTIVNRTPINSMNVGGRTLICAEDMAYHGFTVVWDETARTLKVAKGGTDLSGGKQVIASPLPVGARMGSYYYTDIVTYLDEKAIDSYNTGGRTYFCAEDMSAFGYSVTWDGTARTLTVDTPDLPQELLKETPVLPVSISMNDGGDLYIGETHQFVVTFSPETTTTRGIAWTSSDSKVATVSENGLVTAVGVGKATITAKAINGVRISKEITVIKPESITIGSTYIARNFLDGIEPGIIWRNNSGKVIKYITFTVTPYNAVGDVAPSQTTGRTTFDLRVTGPIETFTLDKLKSLSYKSVCLCKDAAQRGDEVFGFTKLYIDNDQGKYYYFDLSEYATIKKVYVDVESNYKYICDQYDEWDAVWYNPSIVRFVINIETYLASDRL